MPAPPARRPTRIGRLFAALLLPLLGAACARPEPVQALQHGPFEIAMGTRRIGAGGFPNTNANPFKTIPVSDFELRLRGQPVQVPGVGTHFWQVLRLSGTPQPALLVVERGLYLVTERDGRAQVQPLGRQLAEMPVLQWLDEVDGQPGPPRRYGLELRQLEADTQAPRGRRLLVDNQSLLDLATLSVAAVQPWIGSGSADPMAGLNASTARAVALSPRGTQVALPASGRLDSGEDVTALLVMDAAQGGSYGVRLEPARMRRDGPGEPSAAWIAHHFEWVTQADGRERLRARAQFKPWPRRGQLLAFGGQHSYRVPQAQPALARPLAELLRQRFGARPQPEVDANGLGRYDLPSCRHHLALVHQEDYLGLYAPTASTPPWVRCEDELRAIAAAFDAELASGRHDALFNDEAARAARAR